VAAVAAVAEWLKRRQKSQKAVAGGSGGNREDVAGDIMPHGVNALPRWSPASSWRSSVSAAGPGQHRRQRLDQW